MKIISNFKDYYDYMVSKYGADPLVLYERIPEQLEDDKWIKTGIWVPEYIKDPKRLDMFTVHFCGKVYYIYYIFGDWFFGPGVLDAIPERYPEGKTLGLMRYTEDNRAIIRSWRSDWDEKKKRWFSWYNRKEQGGPSKENFKANNPIVLGKHRNIRLKDIMFNRIMDPDETFVTIANWLSKEKTILNNQTDKEKIIAHGFDTKTSFRKM